MSSQYLPTGPDVSSGRLTRSAHPAGDVPRAIAGSLWTSLSKGTYYLNAHYHFKGQSESLLQSYFIIH